jgi:hypothetical protein
LNAGFPQYGTLQELRLFRRLVAAGVASDCVTFVLFYGGNDLITTVNRTGSEDWFRPYVESLEGVCEIVDPTQKGFSEWRAQVSGTRFPALCQFSYTAYTAVEAWRRLNRDKDQESSLREISSAEMLNGLGFTISEFARTCPVHPGKVVFVYVPGRKYFEDSSYRKRTDQEFEAISRIVTASYFDIVDLRGTLSALDYYKYDGHWKPAGHSKAATALADYLERTGKIKYLHR